MYKRQEQGIDLSGDKMAMQRIKEAAEKAKIELSGVTSAAINLPFITADATGPKHLDMTLTLSLIHIFSVPPPLIYSWDFLMAENILGMLKV